MNKNSSISPNEIRIESVNSLLIHKGYTYRPKQSVAIFSTTRLCNVLVSDSSRIHRLYIKLQLTKVSSFHLSTSRRLTADASARMRFALICVVAEMCGPSDLT